MCDFNQRLTVNEAVQRGRALDDEGLYWIEEPVRHDDYGGYARIAAEVADADSDRREPGGHLRDGRGDRGAVRRARDARRPAHRGVTGWLRAAALAHAHGIEMSSHLFPEFSVHLLGVTPTCHWLEFMDWAEPVIQDPVRVSNGLAQIPDRPGAGLAWNEAAVKRYSV